MSNSTALSSSRRDLGRVGGPAATCAMAMAAFFVVLLVVLHIVRADFDPSWHMISEYAIGPTGWLMTAAFFSLGAALLALATALAPRARGWQAATGIVLLTIGGIGAVMGGLFPMGPVGTPMEQATRHGMLHGVSFMLGVPGTVLGMTFLSAHLWRRPGWGAGRGLLLATIGLVWLTLIVFAASMLTLMSKGASGPEFLVGWLAEPSPGCCVGGMATGCRPAHSFTSGASQ